MKITLFVTVVAWALVLSVVTDSAVAGEILDDDFGVKKIVDGCRFTEGPVVDESGVLFFSDGPNDRIVRYGRDGKISDFRKPCGRTNGMTIDHERRMILCQSAGPGGGKRVTRLERNGTETVLASTYKGQPFNAPNDVCIDRHGRIFFTDPNFGQPSDGTQPVSGVYRIDAPEKVTLVIENLQRPNGIVINHDTNRLYVSDRGTQKLHRYIEGDDGSLEPDGIVYDFSPDRGIDGMRLDVHGNIYGAAGKDATTGLFVINPDGKRLLHKPMPEFSTNLAFGGPDMRDLYFTASKSVYHLRTKNPGAKLPPKE